MLLLSMVLGFSEWNLSVSKEEGWKHSLRVDARASEYTTIYIMVEIDNPRLQGVEQFLRDSGTNSHRLHTLSDVMRYTQETQIEENDRWGMSEWIANEDAAKNYGPDTEGYQKSAAARLRMSGQIQELLDGEKCDNIAGPWWTDTTAPISGCPQISIPLHHF